MNIEIQKVREQKEKKTTSKWWAWLLESPDQLEKGSATQYSSLSSGVPRNQDICVVY